MGKGNRIKQLGIVERSPEKAGVGGSIPSLATSFNNLQPAIFRFGCIWLHFRHALSYPTTRTTGTGTNLLTYSVSLRTALRCDSGTICW